MFFIFIHFLNTNFYKKIDNYYRCIVHFIFECDNDDKSYKRFVIFLFGGLGERFRMKIWICDDDSRIIEQIKKVILNVSAHLEVTCFHSIYEMTNKVQMPDILFIDIVSENESIIDTVKTIQKKSNCKIIYCSKDTKHLENIFETDPVYFLLKPLKTYKIELAINKAIKIINNEKKHLVVLEYNHQIEIIDTYDIYYVESDKRKLHFYGNFGKRTIYQKLDDFEKKVNEFIRCHKSYLVNIRYISIFSKDGIILNNDKKIPVSYKKYKEAKKHFLYILNGFK